MNRTRYLQRCLSQNDAKTIGKRMKRLVKRNKFAELERLSICLPNTPEYINNEGITRAKIALAWHKKDLQTVYSLIEEGKFCNGEDLIKLWDEAHCYGAKCRNAVQRFRIRQRFLPPKSICPSGARKKRGMPKVTCDALLAWAKEHGSYPTVNERLTLAQKYNVTNDQLKTWFSNLRRRLGTKTSECPNNPRQLTKGRGKSETCLRPFGSETQCQLANVTESIDQSVSSIFSSENSWKQEDVAPLSEQSNTPLSSSETQWKLEYDIPLADQSHAPEYPSSQLKTPWKLDQGTSSADQSSSPWLPNESQWKLEDVVPSLDQRYRTLSDTEAVLPQSYSTDNATTAPAVMGNSFASYTAGLNCNIPPVAPAAIAIGGQHHLPWLHKVVLFAPIPSSTLNFNVLPAPVCVPSNLCWSKVPLQANKLTSNSVEFANLEVPSAYNVNEPTVCK